MLVLPHRGTPCRSTMEKMLQNQRAMHERYGAMTDEQISGVIHAAFVDLRAALPSRNMQPVRIVDIGCGLAMYHVFIRHYFHDRSDHVLVDRSTYQIGQRGFERHSRRGGFGSVRQMPFYTSAECAREIAFANGFDATNWHWVNASAQAVASLGAASVDIVMSLLSWGFHYPVAVYVDAVRSVLKPDGRLIITLRSGAGEEASLDRAGFACKLVRLPIIRGPQWHLYKCHIRRGQ